MAVVGKTAFVTGVAAIIWGCLVLGLWYLVELTMLTTKEDLVAPLHYKQVQLHKINPNIQLGNN